MRSRLLVGAAAVCRRQIGARSEPDRSVSRSKKGVPRQLDTLLAPRTSIVPKRLMGVFLTCCLLVAICRVWVWSVCVPSSCVFGCKHPCWLVCRLGVSVFIAAGSSQRKSFVTITCFVFCCALRGYDAFSSFVLAGERTPADCMKIAQPRVRKP